MEITTKKGETLYFFTGKVVNKRTTERLSFEHGSIVTTITQKNINEFIKEISGYAIRNYQQKNLTHPDDLLDYIVESVVPYSNQPTLKETRGHLQ